VNSKKTSSARKGGRAKEGEGLTQGHLTRGERSGVLDKGESVLSHFKRKKKEGSSSLHKRGKGSFFL